MKKGKYIDYNILLACLSKKPAGINNPVQQDAATRLDSQRIVVFAESSPALRVA